MAIAVGGAAYANNKWIGQITSDVHHIEERTKAFDDRTRETDLRTRDTDTRTKEMNETLKAIRGAQEKDHREKGASNEVLKNDLSPTMKSFIAKMETVPDRLGAIESQVKDITSSHINSRVRRWVAFRVLSFEPNSIRSVGSDQRMVEFLANIEPMQGDRPNPLGGFREASIIDPPLAVLFPKAENAALFEGILVNTNQNKTPNHNSLVRFVFSNASPVDDFKENLLSLRDKIIEKGFKVMIAF